MLRNYFLCSLSAIALMGCAGGTIGPSERATEARMQDAQAAISRQRGQLAPANTQVVREVNEAFTSSSARRSDRGDPLPRQFERPDGFEARRTTPMQLFEIATLITERTRIPVTFSPDVFSNASAAMPTPGTPGVPGAPGAAGGPGAATPPDVAALLASLGATGPQQANQANFAGGNTANVQGNLIRPVVGTRAAMNVQYSGRLSVFLNQVASHFGVGWEYSAGEIRVYRNQTRTFTIHALPATVSLSTNQSSDASSRTGSAGGGGSGGGTQGQASQRVSTEVNIRLWEEMTNQVTSIVGSEGRISASPATGTISVTAPPPTIARVESYMERQNERLSRQVMVSAQILSVDITDSDSFSLDLQGLFNRAGDFGVAFGNLPNAAAASLVNNALARNNSGVPGLSMGITNPTSQWTNSGALIEALRTRGRVSVAQTGTAVTLNGVPAPIHNQNARSYVASLAVTDNLGAGGGTGSTNNTRTTIVPGEVTTGFAMTILPRVTPDGQSVMMQFTIDISELVGPNEGFRTYTSSAGTISLPDINKRSFVQQAQIPSGSSLVLTGFEQNSENADRRGTLAPEFMGLGGRQSGRRGRQATVVILTPQVLTNRAITVE